MAPKGGRQDFWSACFLGDEPAWAVCLLAGHRPAFPGARVDFDSARIRHVAATAILFRKASGWLRLQCLSLSKNPFPLRLSEFLLFLFAPLFLAFAFLFLVGRRWHLVINDGWFERQTEKIACFPIPEHLVGSGPQSCLVLGFVGEWQI